jgi:hypothetical protein
LYHVNEWWFVQAYVESQSPQAEEAAAKEAAAREAAAAEAAAAAESADPDAQALGVKGYEPGLHLLKMVREIPPSIREIPPI